MNSKSKWACRFSLRQLVNGGWAYLWTLTTSDIVDLKELSQRWRNLITNGFPACVRVFERHPGGHGYHVHFVTSERLEVDKIRVRAEAAGFGRVNVRRIPGKKAEYVSKYLTKQRGMPGVRMWACVGFKGVPANRVKKETLVHRSPKNATLEPLTFVEWQWPDGSVSRVEHRVASTGAHELVRKVQVSPSEMECVLNYLRGGVPVLLGLYRGLRVVQVTIRDRVTNQSVNTVRLDHVVQCGRRLLHIALWLPSDADPSSYVAELAVGSAVLVALSRIVSHRGNSYYAGSVCAVGTHARVRTY